MTEHSGLSRLADVAHREITGGDGPYPVKKKGERRRLDPNWTAIAWLEAATLDATEIIGTQDLAVMDMPGLLTLTAAGKSRALARRANCVRRMFDVFSLDYSSSRPRSYTPCPDCDNFAVSWNCPEHPEGGKQDESFKMPPALMEAFQEQTDRMLLLADMTPGLPPRQGFTDSWGTRIDALADGSLTITFAVEESVTRQLAELSGMTYQEWRERDGDTPTFP